MERVRKEDEERKEKEEKDRERRKKITREKEKEENKLLIREAERAERKEKKRVLERKWEMMRWVTEFLSETDEKWRRERKEREEENGRKLADWEKKSRLEKIAILKRKYGEKEKAETNPRNIRETKRKNPENWRKWRITPPTQ